MNDRVTLAIVLALGSAAWLYPLSRILKRIGLRRRQALWAIVPLVNVVALFRLAYKPWPIADNDDLAGGGWCP